MKTDIELLREFSGSNSNDAFEFLMKRHLDWIYSVALRQVGGDSHLVQRSFKNDLGIVVENDFSSVLGTKREVTFRFTKLVVR